MKDIIILCEDSFGLDVKMMIHEINKYWNAQKWGTPYRIKGFLKFRPMDEDLTRLMTPDLGYMEDWDPMPEERFAMGIVNPQHKKQAVGLMKEKGAVFETLWAPWVNASLDFQFPEGCIIAAQSVMDSARIGSFTTLFHSMIGFDAVVEDYSSVMCFTNITSSHIEPCALVGDNCVVIDRTVGEEATVLPNSVVVKDVKAGTTVFGNPARRVKNI